MKEIKRFNSIPTDMKVDTDTLLYGKEITITEKLEGANGIRFGSRKERNIGTLFNILYKMKNKK